jgi:multiple sugar transport system permease protein
MDFIARGAPLGALSADSAENRWRAALARDHGTPEAANGRFGTGWRSFDQAIPPQAVSDWQYVRNHAAELRWDFATRNFRAVTGYILLHGRAVFNTVAFCALAILAAVIVNPLCAYALSRYPLPYAYKVLLFLLATMAFPAEVAMIPNFLLLRDLGLLNTFGALVLPGLASGFSIFLLKGFFDSLPRELYEAGILDGASEIGMFRRITVPLSLPIFSVIALNAFTASYGAFLFALVVCQDPKMWTLMVWLYDLQATAPQYVIMAALTLAALPTLVVFLFAQKVIMRGIILPSFK